MGSSGKPDFDRSTSGGSYVLKALRATASRNMPTFIFCEPPALQGVDSGLGGYALANSISLSISHGGSSRGHCQMVGLQDLHRSRTSSKSFSKTNLFTVLGPHTIQCCIAAIPHCAHRDDKKSTGRVVFANREDSSPFLVSISPQSCRKATFDDYI